MIGYLGHDVFLPCKFIPGAENDNISQVQWGFKENEGNETLILVSNRQLGLTIHESFLKDKVALEEQTLIIRDLEERDAGLYTCRISAFPGGSFEASVRLVLQGKRDLQLSAVAAEPS